jgi:hypothetical protein
MHACVLLEFNEKSVERFEIVGGRGGIEIEDGGEREAEEEVVGCATGEVAGCERGKAGEIIFGKEECVEPVYSTFVTGTVSNPRRQRERVKRLTTCGDSPELISA